MALTASAVAAYNQGHMELAEKYAEQACDIPDALKVEPYFQLTRIRLNRRNYDGAWQAALQAITLDHRYAARLPLDSEFRRNAAGINPAWSQYANKLRERIEAAVQSASTTVHELARSREETNRLRNSPAFQHLALAGLAQANARFQQMTGLVNTLSSETEKSLKVLADSLQVNSVFAFLEAEKEAQRVNDLAAGALAASREAEFTLRKIDELSHLVPKVKAASTEAIFSGLKEATSIRGTTAFGYVFLVLVSFLVLVPSYALVSTILESGSIKERIRGATVCLVILIIGALICCVFLACCWKICVRIREAFRQGIRKCIRRPYETFDWSTANAPQTTAATDGTILRANEAMRMK